MVAVHAHIPGGQVWGCLYEAANKLRVCKDAVKGAGQYGQPLQGGSSVHLWEHH